MNISLLFMVTQPLIFKLEESFWDEGEMSSRIHKKSHHSLHDPHFPGLQQLFK